SLVAGSYPSTFETVLAQTGASDRIAAPFASVVSSSSPAGAVISYRNAAGTEVGTQALNGGATTLSANANRVILRIGGTTVVNKPPTNLSLSPNPATVQEHLPAGTIVGTFSTADADSIQFTYTLVPGIGATDNASFTIGGPTLLAGVSFDYATQSSYA